MTLGSWCVLSYFKLDPNFVRINTSIGTVSSILLPPQTSAITIHLSSYVDEWKGDEDYYESNIDDIDVEVYVDIDDQDLDLTVRHFQFLV